MKLVMTTLSNKDVAAVQSATATEGFKSTRVSSQGMFLENGNSTVLFGVEDEKVDTLIELIKQNISKRVIRKTGVASTIEGSLLNKPVDVEEYGAVVFVINVEEFYKL